MARRHGTALARFVARAFEPREIFCTWAGRFHYLRLSPRVQMAGAAGAAAIVAWAGIATVGHVLDQRDLAGQRLEIADRARAQAVLERDLKRGRDERAALTARIAGLDAALAREIAGRAALRDQRDSLAGRIGDLERRLADLGESEHEVVERLIEQAREGSEIVEKTIAMAGLDAAKLLAGLAEATPGPSDSGPSDSGPSDSGPGDPKLAAGEIGALGPDGLGQGGPFIPAGGAAAGFESGAEPGAELARLLARLDARLERWSALRQAVRSLPLAAPLDQFRISSTYGRRRDPVTGRKARHLGIDFVAPPGTPVHATSPGTVVFAGRHGRYGRLVEIDHGHGLRTRYAHLRRILVKEGQELAHRHKIGLLGSSGRSTGPHLHYEVRFEGRTQNPMKYILAGQHLFKD